MKRQKTVYLEIYDAKLKGLTVVSDFISLQWTDAIAGGSFELVVASIDSNAIRLGAFVVKSDDTGACFITEIEVNRTFEGEKIYTIRGKSALWLLDMRVNTLSRIIKGSNYDGCSYDEVIEELFPRDTKRSLYPLSTIENSSIGEEYPPGEIKTWVVGIGSLYDIFMAILPEQYFYREKFNRENSGTIDTGIFLTIKEREDYTNEIFFADEFDTLLAWSFWQDQSNYKNVAFVAGEGEGQERKRLFVGDSTGLNRFEVYVDARDLQSDTDDGLLTAEEYENELKTRGREKLKELGIVYSETVEVSSTKYDIDASWLGRVVTIQTDDYTANASITELTEIYDEAGYSIFPTFEILGIHMQLATEDYDALITEDGNLIYT